MRTNTPFAVTPVTTAENFWPTRSASATAAIRLFMSRCTLRAASSFSVQLRAVASSSASV